MLYLVATPIGHLKDMSFRAVETLRSVDVIYAEDTRVSKKLCQEFDIATPMSSYHEHNAVRQIPKILEILRNEKSVALISDAGTPTINDPGYRLVKAVTEAQLPITVVPGPTALIAALSMSGLPTDRFIFEGFLPPKTTQRRKRLTALINEERTMIFYETPQRLVNFLQDAHDVWGDIHIVCIKEITKQFEQIYAKNISDLLTEWEGQKLRGEWVVVVNLREKVWPV